MEKLMNKTTLFTHDRANGKNINVGVLKLLTNTGTARYKTQNNVTNSCKTRNKNINMTKCLNYRIRIFRYTNTQYPGRLHSLLSVAGLFFCLHSVLYIYFKNIQMNSWLLVSPHLEKVCNAFTKKSKPKVTELELHQVTVTMSKADIFLCHLKQFPKNTEDEFNSNSVWFSLFIRVPILQ